MSVVTLTEPVPVRLVGVYEFVRGRAISEADLSAAISPASLRRGDELIGRVIDAAVEVGLITREDGMCSTPHEFSNAADVRDYLEAAILGTTGTDTKQGSVARAIAWFLTLPPQPVALTAETALVIEQDCGGENFDVSNESRVGQLAYWLTYLGFAWRINLGNSGSCIQPDATTVLERHLRDVVIPNAMTPLNEVMSAVSTRCPVFEGGSVRSEVESMIATRRRDGSVLSPLTSLALARLSTRGVLELTHVEDFPPVRLTYPEERNWTHVTLKAAN
jgi:hypothetical protein